MLNFLPILDLKRLSVTCCGINEHEWNILEAVREKYLPLCKKMKTTLEISCDLYEINPT